MEILATLARVGAEWFEVGTENVSERSLLHWLSSEALTMLFAEEDPTLAVSPDWRPKNTWCVLMVDDDAEVHTVTRLALRGYEFQGRSLEFISAFSGKEGQQIFEDRKDIALALVDVVMERDQAGLELVDYVRRTLDNHHSRLVLRTGQPGLASRKSSFDAHEIDDFREKTDLTIQKLRALLDSQLGAYRGPELLQWRDRRRLEA